MKSLTLLLATSLLATGLGCGGGGGGKGITQVATKTPNIIRFGYVVTPLGEQDGLDSVWVAMVGVGCTAVKARYALSATISAFEAKCGEMAISMAQQDRVLLMDCELSFGASACKSQFAKILGSARDVKYIK